MNQRHDSVEGELASMRRRMHRLAAINVVLAAVVLAFGGAGAAYALAAANSVNSASIIDGSIVTPDLKAGAISGSRLLDSGITSSKIYDGTLTKADLGSHQITSSKIGTITTRSSASVSLDPNTSTPVSVSCEAGEIALSGGIVYTSNSVGLYTQDAGVITSSNGPIPDEFNAYVYNSTVTSRSAQAHVYCLQP